MRVYVVVTSYRPLRAYVSRLGFARFCSVSYSEAKADMDNPFVHLTNGTYCSHRPRGTPRGTLNPKPLSSIHASIIHLTFIHSFIRSVAIQKKGEDYNASHGNKWAIHLLRLYIEGTMGKEVADTLFRQIDEAIVYSLKSVQNVIINDRRCFELYGYEFILFIVRAIRLTSCFVYRYDLLIDEQLKPWLIEVNASPSLTCTTEDDRKLKDRVMRDALAVAVPPGKLEAAAGGVSRTTALSRLSRGGRSGVGGDKGAVAAYERDWARTGGVPECVLGTMDVLIDESVGVTEQRGRSGPTRGASR